MGISKAEKKNYLEVIEMEYKALEAKWGYSYKVLFAKFLIRQREVIKKKENLETFFRSEVEAVDIFKKKLHEKNKESNPDSVTELEASPQKELTENFYLKYPRVKIHDHAAIEIEYLLGCMILFRRDFISSLESTKAIIRDKTYHTICFEIENLLDNVGFYENEVLPKIFANYFMKLEHSSKDKNISERAQRDVYKAVIDLMRRISRILKWLSYPNQRIRKNYGLTYKKHSYDVKSFAKKIEEDCKEISDDFGLSEFF